MSYKKRTASDAATRKKPKKMTEKLKALLVRFNPHSKVFIVAVFSVFFLILILITIQFRVGQSEQNNTSQISPSPSPRVLTPGRDYVEGQINVKFADGMTDEKINSLLADYNASIKSTISGINVKVVEVPVGQEEEIRKQLVEQGVVKYAELEGIVRTQPSPNDPEYSKQYGFNNTGQSIKGQAGKLDSDIKLESAWDVAKGSGVKIAVLDSGIDLNHPDLASKVVLQKVFAANSVLADKLGHGTHVAGIISANTNNTQGVAGTCPDCQLMIGKVISDGNVGQWSEVASGVTWAADNGAKVINMSLGGYEFSNTLKDAVNYALQKSVIIVTAAGNDNTTNKFYPGGYDGVITVAATDNKDQKASFSNYGDWVEVAAPGKDIFSTLPTESHSYQGNGVALNYDYLSGTSMAAPMVSGVVALIWSTQPNASSHEIINKLYDTADKINGTGSSWTKGRVNAEAAVGGGNRLPTGVVDEYSCSKVRGWAYDPDESGKSIGVHVYVNGPVGTPNVEGHDLGATSINRPDVNSARGITGTHGFDWSLPGKYRDGKSHEVFVYAIDSQGGTNPEIGHGNTGNCPVSTHGPTTTITPTAPPPTGGVTPTPSIPPFVCGGSPNSICNTPTPGRGPTNTPTPTIRGVQPTIDPNLTPTITPVPVDDCLDPRSTPERINDWVQGFLKKIGDYVQSIFGNPQNPPPPPPQPCIVR